MPRDAHNYPSEDDLKLFNRLITAVRRNVDWFAAPAADLDRDYSTQAIRDRLAEEIRQHRLNPNHTKRSRAYRRKHCQHEVLSLELGTTVTPVDVVPSPRKRPKGEDGKPQQPSISLRERFSHAFIDTFHDDTALYVLEEQQQIPTAARRLLLAWLRLDPDRSSLKRITIFQDLRSFLTEDGNLPLIASDDEDEKSREKSLYIRRDGGIKRDAETWIGKAKEAADILDPHLGISSVTVDDTTGKIGADDEPGEAPAQTIGPKTVAQGGMAWQKAMQRAEAHVKAHDGAFSSVKRLAEIVGCSRPTITKAISRSPYLKARKAEKIRSARTWPLTGNAIEEASEQAHKDELSKLVEEQKVDQARDDRQEKAAKKHRT